jgi:hypothetical protein
VYESWRDSAEGEPTFAAFAFVDPPEIELPEDSVRRRRLKGMSEGGGKLILHSSPVTGKVAQPAAPRRAAPVTRSPRRLLYTLLNLRN